MVDSQIYTDARCPKSINVKHNVCLLKFEGKMHLCKKEKK